MSSEGNRVVLKSGHRTIKDATTAKTGSSEKDNKSSNTRCCAKYEGGYAKGSCKLGESSTALGTILCPIGSKPEYNFSEQILSYTEDEVIPGYC